MVPTEAVEKMLEAPAEELEELELPGRLSAAPVVLLLAPLLALF